MKDLFKYMDKVQYILIACIVVLLFGIGWIIDAYCKETVAHKANLLQIEADLERLKAKEEKIIQENRASRMKDYQFDTSIERRSRDVRKIEN